MKRKLFVTVLLILCVHFLLGFGFTQVYKVEKAIKNIGFVTIESREKIETAEKMYAELSYKNQMKVDNYSVLLQARAELDRLLNLVNTAQQAINEIRLPVTRESGDSIIAAQKAYQAAREASVHSYITGYDTLYYAVEPYAAIIIEDAGSLMKQRKYAEAYELYLLIYSNFANCSYGADTYYGLRNASVDSVEQLFNSGRLEDALNALDEIDQYYGTSDGSTTLRNKVLNRLAQSRPITGKKFADSIGWGYGKFVVTAGEYDACVTLKNLYQPSQYMFFYIRAGETATMQVKDGQYTASYITGPYWFGADNNFGGYYRNSGDVDGTLDFSTTRDSANIYYDIFEINLNNLDTYGQS